METSAGVGLANTAARLRQLFGANYELVIQNRVPTGVEARLSIPLRLAQTS
jgi:LytS/YehU family sensor histidine kinase